MYALRTDVHFLQGFWVSSVFRYFVVFYTIAQITLYGPWM